MRFDAASFSHGSLPFAVVLLLTACGMPSGDYSIDTRNGDVFASGPEPTVSDSVVGDAVLAGGEITFSGSTGADYLGAGGTQNIGGRIHGSIRAAGGEVKIAATVDRNVAAAGGRIEIDRAANIAKNAYLAGGEVEINGRVGQGLRVAGGSVTINGNIGSDVEITAGELHIAANAVIAGPLRYRVPAEHVVIDRNAKIAGPVTALPGKNFSGFTRVIRILWIIGFLVAGLVVVAMLPGLAGRTADRLRQQPGAAAVTGAFLMIVLPVIAMFIAVTVIGIPLALLTLFGYFVLAYVGIIMLAVWLGQLLIGEQGNSTRRGVVLSFLAGGLGIGLLLTIPFIGGFAWILAAVVGAGALFLALRDFGRTAVV
jgi:hypothetical protein